MNQITRNKLLEVLRTDLNIPDSIGLCVKLESHFDIQVKVPELECDKWMKEGVHARGRNERRVVFDLFMHLCANGFRIVEVSDGEENVKIGSALDATEQAKEAMETLFAVDEAVAYVCKEGFKTHYIQFVFGNADDGSESIADWSFSASDEDGFNKLMEEYTNKLGD